MATVTAPVPLPVIDGGTGSSSTLNAGGVLYAVTSTSVTTTPVGTSGYFLKSNAGAAPTWAAVGGVITGLTQNTIPKANATGDGLLDSSISVTATGEMVVTSTSAVDCTLASFIDPTVPAGTWLSLALGKTVTNQNCALMQFRVDSSSPANNFLRFIVFGGQPIDITQSGNLNATSLTLANPLSTLYGGTGTSVGGTTTASPSTTVARDSQANILVNNEIQAYSEFTADGATHTLLASSPPFIKITGGSTPGTIFVLPSASTGGPSGAALPKGFRFTFDNNSGSQSITIQRSGGAAFFPSPPTALTVANQYYVQVFITDNTTPAGLWDAHFLLPNNLSANYFIAGPPSGSGTSPAARTLVPADLASTTSGSTAKNLLVSAGSGSTPTWTTMDLSSSAAVGSSILGVTNGGTGLSSTTANQLLYSSATNTIAGLTMGVAGNVLIGSGSPAAPLWSTIDLNATTAVGSSILKAANGGTGSNLGSAAVNDTLWFSSTGVISNNHSIIVNNTGGQTWNATTHYPLLMTTTMIDTEILTIKAANLTGSHYCGVSIGTDTAATQNCWQILYRPQSSVTTQTLTFGVPSLVDFLTLSPSAMNVAGPVSVVTPLLVGGFSPFSAVASSLASGQDMTVEFGQGTGTNTAAILGYHYTGTSSNYTYLQVAGGTQVKVDPSGFIYTGVAAGTSTSVQPFYYDEGVWTPAWWADISGTATIVSASYTTQLGSWIRFGRMLSVSATVRCTNNWGGVVVWIQGLPAALGFAFPGQPSQVAGILTCLDNTANINGQANPITIRMMGKNQTRIEPTSPIDGTTISFNNWTPVGNLAGNFSCNFTYPTV